MLLHMLFFRKLSSLPPVYQDRDVYVRLWFRSLKKTAVAFFETSLELLLSPHPATPPYQQPHSL
jgi:hypothetical protein